MPLFPEIDVSRFAPGGNGAGPALPPGGTSGVLPGLEESLKAILRNYRPGDIGICEVADKLQLSMPLPYWGEYPYYTVGRTASVTAASTDPIVVYTVPMDRRYLLQDVQWQNVSGDNLANLIQIDVPAANITTNGGKFVLSNIAAAVVQSWPVYDAGDLIWVASAGPKLLEPGTVIELVPSGAGVAATLFDYWISGMLIPIIRAQSP